MLPINLLFSLGAASLVLAGSDGMKKASVRDKRQTITIAHQFEVVDESNFQDGSDALKGISPASGDAGTVTAHQFQSDCATLRAKSATEVLSYMSLAQASCGLPYEAMKSRSGNQAFCSGMAASNFAAGAAGGCGACIKLSYRASSCTSHTEILPDC